MLKYFTINTSAELLCFVVALICLSKDKSIAWRIMIFFLLVTCIAELTGIYVKRLYLSDTVHIHPNAWVYNIFIFAQVTFFSYFFQFLLKKYNYSKPIIFGGLACLIALHIYGIVSQTIFIYDELTNTVLSVLLVLYSLYYFYCLIKDDKHIQIAKSAGFWWVTGILFFYFGTTAYNIFYDQLSSIVNRTGQNSGALKYLHNVFNIILYSCWSYSIICRKWELKRPAN